MDRWWYECVEAVRRLCMTGFLVLFQDGSLRLAVATFLAFISVLLHTTTTPYTDSATNALALVSHLLVFSTFFVGQQIAAGVVPNDSLEVGIALVLIVASAPVMMVYFQMTQDQRDRVEELRRREREVQNEEMMNQIKAFVNEQDSHLRIMSADGTDGGEHEPDLLSDPKAPPSPPPVPPPHAARSVVRFDDSAYPCYVMSLTNLQTCDSLPTHEEAYESGLLQVLTQRSMVPNGAATYFISQNWESESGPDNELKTKLHWLQNMRAHLHIAEDREVRGGGFG